MKRNIISDNMLVMQNNCQETYAVIIAVLKTKLKIEAAMMCLQKLYMSWNFEHDEYVI